ncbi:efflux RND transporter periplasmic adaptor subunit [Novosphingobium aquiterrae]|uniref:Efflux RND transporter periplasmic adaptor subunit n=1 Tax=Novosphingobium aquiterrae TaxID=624388 RepID=A0ABV6PE15_9SPHN
MLRYLVQGLAILVIAACSSPPPKPENRVFDVRVTQVGSRATAAMLSAVGTVHLRRETTLAFTSPGRIARISVNEGDRVARGQVLAALDMTTVDAQLAAADAEQVRTAAELKRSAALLDKGWVTKARLDNARAAYQSAVATSRVRRFAANTARIVARGGGVVLARPAEPAQTVDAGTPVLVVGDERAGYVLRLPVSDRDAVRLRAGAPAMVKIAALGEGEIAATVSQIGGRADPATGTFAVELALPSLPGLRSGQIGSAQLTVSESAGDGALLVPPAALFASRAGEGFVYVVPAGSNRVMLRKVSVADARDGGLVVTKGLAPGEWVVVSNLDRLSDQTKVNPVRAAR